MALSPRELRETHGERRGQADTLEKEIDEALPEAYRHLDSRARIISVDLREEREIHTEVQIAVRERYVNQGWANAFFHQTLSAHETGKTAVRYFTLRFPD